MGIIFGSVTKLSFCYLKNLQKIIVSPTRIIFMLPNNYLTTKIIVYPTININMLQIINDFYSNNYFPYEIFVHVLWWNFRLKSHKLTLLYVNSCKFMHKTYVN